MLVHLIGPGGAGKTTTGKALAHAMNLAFVDLDEEYLKSRSIDDDINNFGYEFYAHANTETYLRLHRRFEDAVWALSSGFMTYPTTVHPETEEIQRRLLCSKTTILLLPSFESAKCIEETVRRQMSRPHASSEDREREKIRRRFPVYASMNVNRVRTDVLVEHVVQEVIAVLHGSLDVVASA
jgi:shikimate kinase